MIQIKKIHFPKHFFYLLLIFSQSCIYARISFAELIDTPEKFEAAFRDQNRPKHHYKVVNLYGRIIHRNQEKWKSEKRVGDSTRKTAFFMGPDGLQIVLDTPSTLEVLIKIGYPTAYIHRLIKEEKEHFKLIIVNECCEVKVATWNHVQDLVQHYFPDAYEKVRYSLDEIKKLPFHVIDSYVPLDSTDTKLAQGTSFSSRFDRIDRTGPSHPLYMNYSKIREIEHPTLWQVRGFLYNDLRLGNLFTGLGTVMDENHNHGFQEYLGKNVTFEEIPEGRLIPLELPESF